MTNAERKKLRDKNLAAIKEPEKVLSEAVQRLEREIDLNKKLRTAESFLDAHPRKQR